MPSFARCRFSDRVVGVCRCSGFVGSIGWFSKLLGGLAIGGWLRSSGMRLLASASWRCNSASCLRSSASFSDTFFLSGGLGCDFDWLSMGLSEARRCRIAFATDRTRAIILTCDGLWSSSRGGVELLGLSLGMRSLFLARLNLSRRCCRGLLLGPSSSGDSGVCCSWLRSAIVADWSLARYSCVQVYRWV